MFKNKDPLDQAVLSSIAVFGALLVAMAAWHAVDRSDQQVAEAPAAQEAPAEPQSETVAAEPAAQDSPEPTDTEDAQSTEAASAEPAAEEPAAEEPAPAAETSTADANSTPEESDTAAAEPQPAEQPDPAPAADSGPEASAETETATAESGPPAASEDNTTNDSAPAESESETAAAQEETPATEESDVTAEAASSGAFPEAQMAYLEGDAEAGAKVWNQCRACHVADQEQNRVGPHLVNIVGRETASIENFSYSQALQDLQGQQWTPEEMDSWLTNPREYAQGTKMSYAGVKDEDDRRNLLAYLWSLQN